MDKKRLSEALSDLSDMVSRLRGPDGCPWDAVQTDTTVKMYLLEEAYEVLDAIERGSPEEVCQELGDLLFQIMFLARLGEERGEFGFAEVIERITEKMKNRHPHVFGEAVVKNAEEVAKNWQKIKRREKETSATLSSMLQEVPMGLPALLRAHRLVERASRADVHQANGQEKWKRAKEVFEELGTVIQGGDEARIAKELGDLLFGLADVARELGLNAENLLREANQRFIERFEEIEEKQ